MGAQFVARTSGGLRQIRLKEALRAPMATNGDDVVPHVRSIALATREVRENSPGFLVCVRSNPSVLPVLPIHPDKATMLSDNLTDLGIPLAAPLP
jgi:hypothetical protein